MKLLALVPLTLAITLSLTGCSSKPTENADNGSNTTVKVGVIGDNIDMWVPITENLAKQGITIELIKFSDYSLPNQALADGEIDINAFQHYAYFENEKTDKGFDLTAIGETFLSPMCIYSNSITDVSQLTENAKISLPNDASNQGRALKVLETAGVITIDPAVGFSPTLKDITENPKNIEFVEVDAAQLCSLLPDVDAAVINANYALDNGFIPAEDAIFLDKPVKDVENPFINIIAARTVDKDNEIYKKVVEAYNSDEVIEVFNTAYKGAYLPAWVE